MNKIIKNSLGTTVPELIIGVGILALGSLAFMQMSKNQVVNQKRAEENIEISTVSNLVSQSLSSSDGCFETLKGVSSFAPGTIINSIKNFKGSTILSTGKFGSGVINVKSIKLVDIQSSGVKYFVNVRVDFVKNNKGIKNKSGSKKTIIKKFPVSFVLGDDGKVSSCYSNTRSAIGESSKKACQSIGGALDEGNCNLQQAESTEKNIAVSTKSLNTFHFKKVDPIFIKNEGEEILEGTLKVTNLEVGGNAQFLAPASLYDVQIINQVSINKGKLKVNQACVKASSNTNCRSFKKLECKAGEFLSGIDKDGEKICLPFYDIVKAGLCDGKDLIADPVTKIISCANAPPVDGDWRPSGFQASETCEGETYFSEVRTKHDGSLEYRSPLPGTGKGWKEYVEIEEEEDICIGEFVKERRISECGLPPETRNSSTPGTKPCGGATCPEIKVTLKAPGGGSYAYTLPVTNVDESRLASIIFESDNPPCPAGYDSKMGRNGELVGMLGISRSYRCQTSATTGNPEWVPGSMGLVGCAKRPQGNRLDDYCKGRYGQGATGTKDSGCCIPQGGLNPHGLSYCQ